MSDEEESTKGEEILEKGEIEETGEESIEEGGENGAGKTRAQAEKMFNDFVNILKDRQDEFSKTVMEYTKTLQKPLSDVMETDENLIVKTDLPGVKKEDITINIGEDSLEIIAKFEEESEVTDVDYIQKERSYGEVKRILSLPTKIKIEGSTAKFEDSILTVNLPKLEKRSYNVEIN
jgi:HSP20 family protein